VCPTYTRPNASAWPLLVIQSIVAHVCPVTSVRKFFSPSPSRLGYFKQQFILSRSANVPRIQGAAVSVRGGLALGGPRLQRCFITAVAGSRAGLGTSAPTFGAIGWLSDTAAGRLALGVILPTFAPVGGLGGLMLQTSRRRRARLARRPCRLPCARPWLAWWPLSRRRLAPCARPCVLQPWRGLRPWIRVYG